MRRFQDPKLPRAKVAYRYRWQAAVPRPQRRLTGLWCLEMQSEFALFLTRFLTFGLSDFFDVFSFGSALLTVVTLFHISLMRRNCDTFHQEISTTRKKRHQFRKARRILLQIEPFSTLRSQLSNEKQASKLGAQYTNIKYKCHF